jgi:hypothetical protein
MTNSIYPVLKGLRFPVFTRRCVLWTYLLADPSTGATATVAGGCEHTERLTAAIVSGFLVVGIAGLVPNLDGTASGRLAVEVLDHTTAVRRLALRAALTWEAELIGQGAVTPAATLQ